VKHKADQGEAAKLLKTHEFRCGSPGPVPYAFVEWIRSSSVEQVQAAAITAGLVSEMSDGMVTVYGYR